MIGVLDYVAAVDCGTPINPRRPRARSRGRSTTASATPSPRRWSSPPTAGSATRISPATRSRVAPDPPRLRVILVDSYEPTGPMGAKSVAEIGINAPIPTIANAIYNAVGIRLTETPFTPERVLAALTGR